MTILDLHLAFVSKSMVICGNILPVYCMHTWLRPVADRILSKPPHWTLTCSLNMSKYDLQGIPNPAAAMVLPPSISSLQNQFSTARPCCGDFDAQRRSCKILKVEPFNSDRKRMSVLVGLPDGRVRTFCKGASEIVLKMCDKIIDNNGTTVDLPQEKAKIVNDTIDGFANEALRTLCLAVKDIDETQGENNIPETGYTLIAIVEIKDPVRPGIKEVVQKCLAAGISVRMVTGDNINTAKAIARECGILTEGGIAIEGPEFRNLSPEQMKDIIPRIQVVAVTGDGTNDAPALHESDIGLAMGITGTEVAKENADVIIMDDNFTTIVKVAKWGQAIYINIQKFVQFQLTVNVVALIANFVSASITGAAPNLHQHGQKQIKCGNNNGHHK
ncbi:Alpha carbonic anhydrase 4 [Lathyrus oleraceus]|uniref:Alpha carbonic anhydrase 4 n=1 Tax=Pisum sativum TaxID=3888 RepID=A0A9D5AI44_PEA|nr:Alpha carbonic anhydrase 4 [Pisum sativum]